MVTILEGLRTAFPDREVTHAPGVQIDGGDTSGVPAALDIAHKADVVVLCLGEACAMSGEAASRARPTLPDRQAELARAALEDLTFLGPDLSPCLEPGIFEIHVGPSAARDSLLKTTVRLVADGTADARPSLA
jgi:hypothetical protein